MVCIWIPVFWDHSATAEASGVMEVDSVVGVGRDA
jgi:hypothetical protein